MHPTVSVIIPTHNDEAFIENAVNSVLGQTRNHDLEIIVVDDASVDNTKCIVADLSSRHPQVILGTNARLRGPSGARNTGLSMANARYIAFLDADDVWFENHLQEGIEFLDKHPDIDVVFYNFEMREYGTDKIIGNWFSVRSFSKRLKVDRLDDGYCHIHDDVPNALLVEAFMRLPSMLIRSTVIRDLRFNESIKRSEDRDFCIRLAIESHAQFAYKNLVTGVYYRHDNSLTSKSTENSISILTDEISLFSAYLADNQFHPLETSMLKRMLLEHYVALSYFLRKTANHRLALMTLLRSLRFGVAFSQARELMKILTSILFSHMSENSRNRITE